MFCEIASAVVPYKPHDRKRGSPQDAHPAQCFRPEPATEQEEQADRHAAGKQGKQELPHRQPEEHGFRVVADFLIYLYFQSINTSFWHKKIAIFGKMTILQIYSVYLQLILALYTLFTASI